jgi:hypothetical protein
MVWGIIDPGEYGEYFPQGDYVGWKETLKAHWDDGISTELKARFVEESARERSVAHAGTYSAFVSYKFIKGQGQQVFGLPPFTPIESHEWPKEFRTIFPCKSLGSLIMLHGFMVAVDAAFRAVIERVEPGVHAFSPIRIGQIGDDSPGSTYFVLVIGQFRNSFSPELSDKATYIESPKDRFDMTQKNKTSMANFALSKAAIGRAHLWRELKVYEPKIYLSDELEAEIEKAGLRLPKRFRLKEI